MGCEVWGLRFRVEGVGSGVWGLGSGVWGLGFGVHHGRRGRRHRPLLVHLEGIGDLDLGLGV